MKTLFLMVLTCVILMSAIPVWAQSSHDIVCSETKRCQFTYDANTESDMNHYRFYITQETGEYLNPHVLTVPHPFTQHQSISEFGSESLVPNIRYYVVMTAVDDTGNEGPHSEEVSFVFISDGPLDTDAPAAPVNFRIIVINL